MASINQVAQLIQTVGTTNSIFVEGEMGIGKSSLLSLMRETYDDAFDYVYADCPLMDLPDFALPYVENGTTRYAPSELWALASSKPKIIMLDEVSKAAPVLKPLFTRLLLERTIGGFPLPKGSIVFATGNLSTDGVGDTMQGHINNRIGRIRMDKPSAENWIFWAEANGVDPMVCATVHQLSHCLASYTDPDELNSKSPNPYIYNPKRNNTAFVSPRSLAKAGSIVAKRKELGDELTMLALIGTVGEAFARDMDAYMGVADSLPSWESIEEQPMKAKLLDGPKDSCAQLLLVFSSIRRINKTNAEAYTQYFTRYDENISSIWMRQFKHKLDLVMHVKQFKDALIKNHWIFQ